MLNITVDPNNDITVPKELLPVIKQLLKDELSVEMVKIWTTLAHSQKEALLQEATRAWYLNQAIEAFRGTKTDR